MLSIKPPLNNSDEDTTFTLEDDPKGSVGSLQQPKKTDSPKEKKYLKYFEKGQQVFH